ncbi:MAG TPA: hypothetical protein VNU68_18690 [Verrucomicrobiae bacterium]|nr:hypothetical protein [Verrucomicrobiae bacterium]
MKRKHWIVGSLIFSLLILSLLISVRVRLAKSYMQQQIERLAREGYPGYKIYECNYLGFSDFGGFMCITVTARRKEDPRPGYSDGYHYIEIDFPWISSKRPEHRI